MRTLSIDVSAVKGEETQGSLLGLLKKLGYRYKTFDCFWDTFGKQSNGLSEGVLVLGNLSTIVMHYEQVRPHDWIASVRERRPYFIGLVRTTLDELYINFADELVRNSEMRASLCRNLETDFRHCLLKALSCLKPHALIDVRYSPLSRRLWVQFNDGLFCSVFWGWLGLQKEIPHLILETAVLRDDGAALEILRRNGDILRIDASSVRKCLSVLQPGTSQIGVGNRVRAARSREGMSQNDLARKTGIPQSNISRIERECHDPRRHTMQRLADALECTPAELLFGE